MGGEERSSVLKSSLNLWRSATLKDDNRRFPNYNQAIFSEFCIFCYKICYSMTADYYVKIYALYVRRYFEIVSRYICSYCSVQNIGKDNRNC